MCVVPLIQEEQEEEGISTTQPYTVVYICTNFYRMYVSSKECLFDFFVSLVDVFVIHKSNRPFSA